MLVKNNSGYYTFTSFSKLKDLVHGFSTRKFGDMRFKVAGNEKNRENFFKVLGVKNEVVVGEQVHGNKIAKVNENNLGNVVMGVDGFITAKPNVNLIILSADCLPVFVYDPKKRCVGIAHAGWNGTVAGIAKNLIRKFEDEFDSSPKDLLVGLGPCIEFCHYDVVEDRIKEIRKAGLEKALFKSVSGKVSFSLKEANLQHLLSTGILRNNIDASQKVCTYEDTDMYSWRREKPNLSGNFAAIIGLKK